MATEGPAGKLPDDFVVTPLQYVDWRSVLRSALPTSPFDRFSGAACAVSRYARPRPR